MATHDVTEYGARGDGTALDTEAIQSAIDACAEDGGGTVTVPSGEYLVSPLFLRSAVEFHLEPGAVLRASEDMDAYPVVDGRLEGIERETYAALLTGRDLENVAITGQGTLDGRGQVWWEAFRHDAEVFDEHGLGRADRYPSPDEAILDHARPNAIDLLDCTDVLIRDISIRDSPCWTINPTYCENVTVDNVAIRNPEESENTDGINPSSCRNVKISNCYVDVGDDCVTIKSGFDEDGRRVGEPCENIRATGLVMRDLRRTAFILTMFYHDGEDEAEPVDDGTPQIRNVHYSDITVDGVRNVTTIRGLAEMPVEDFSLVDVTVSDADRGVRAQGVDGMYLRNVSVDADETPAFDIKRTTDLEVERIADPDPDPDQPVVRLEDANVLVRSCRAAEGTGTFVERGADDEVVTYENHLVDADEGVAVRE